jgi:hypothetical protein
MNYRWSNDARSPRQHWLYRDTYKIETMGLVYEVRHDAFTVYLSEKDALVNTRRWVAEMPTLGEAKDLLMTLVGSQT